MVIRGHKQKKKEQGFSLIEIIIVMVIVAIAVLGIVVSVGADNASRHAKEAAQKLEELIQFAQNRAILIQRNHAIMTYSNGYVFLEQQVNLNWKPVANNQFLKHETLPHDVRFKLNKQQLQLRAREKLKPEIYIDADGFTDQFQIIFFSKSGEKLITLNNSAQGQLSIDS